MFKTNSKTVNIHFDEDMTQEEKIKVLKGLRKNFPNYNFDFSFGLSEAKTICNFKPNGINIDRKEK